MDLPTLCGGKFQDRIHVGLVSLSSGYRHDRRSFFLMAAFNLADVHIKGGRIDIDLDGPRSDLVPIVAAFAKKVNGTFILRAQARLPPPATPDAKALVPSLLARWRAAHCKKPGEFLFKCAAVFFYPRTN